MKDIIQGLGENPQRPASPDILTLEVYRTAIQTRNMEISLFWQRCNYFLVLNTGMAVAFFAGLSRPHAIALGIVGVLAALLWLGTALGSKFWQCRWEHRVRQAELQLSPSVRLFSASWEVVQDDVRQSFEFRRRGAVHRTYARLVLMKPSVSLVMTLLAALFVAWWAGATVLVLCGWPARALGG